MGNTKINCVAVTKQQSKLLCNSELILGHVTVVKLDLLMTYNDILLLRKWELVVT